MVETIFSCSVFSLASCFRSRVPFAITLLSNLVAPAGRATFAMSEVHFHINDDKELNSRLYLVGKLTLFALLFTLPKCLLMISTSSPKNWTTSPKVCILVPSLVSSEVLLDGSLLFGGVLSIMAYKSPGFLFLRTSAANVCVSGVFSFPLVWPISTLEAIVVGVWG